MKFNLLPALGLLALIGTSCTKHDYTQPKPAPTQTQGSLGATDVSNLINQDTSGSGVNAVTGLQEIVKHMVDVVGTDGRITPTWDGRYETTWYNNHLWVQIEAYPVNFKLGDPVYAILTPDNNVGVSITGNATSVGGGVTSFTMQIIQMVLSYTYTASDLHAFDVALGGIFTGNGSDYPLPPHTAAIGAAVKTVYGKVVKTTTGSGFALAEINWMPPPTPKLPYTVNQTSVTLPATVTTANGIKTVTVVDNKTFSYYTPTFTFKLTSANTLHFTGANADVTSTYQGITWAQYPDMYAIISPAVPPIANSVQFGLTGHFTSPTVSANPLAVWITYNYSTKMATISYNDSRYLAYWLSQL